MMQVDKNTHYSAATAAAIFKRLDRERLPISQKSDVLNLIFRFETK